MTRARDALLALTAVVCLLDASFLSGDAAPNHMLRIGFTALCVAAMAFCLRRTGSSQQRAWYLITAGLGLWLLADVAMDTLGRTEHDGEQHWASHVEPTDFFYLLSLSLLIAGTFRLTTYRTALRDRTAFLDALIVLLALGSITLTYVLIPEFETARTLDQANLAALAIGVTEPILALLLASGAVRLWIGSGIQVTLSTRLAALGLGLLASSDIVYWARRVTIPAYDVPKDLGLPMLYLAAFGLIAAAVLDPSRTGEESRIAGRLVTDNESRSRLRTVVALGLALVAPVVANELAESAGIAQSGNRAYAGVTLALAALVGVRFYYLLEDQQRLVNRERKLREEHESLIAEHALTVERERSLRDVQAILDNSTNAVFMISTDGEIVYASPSATGLIGYEPEQAVGQKWETFIHSEDKGKAETLLRRTTTGAPPPAEIRIKGHDPLTRELDGSVKFVEVTARQVEFGGEVRHLVTHHDVTLRQQMQQHLEDQAFHDPLTGLANRALFRDKLSEALRLYRHQGLRCHVMLIDLDDFKMVNDSLGHPAGDLLLRTVAARVRECLREEDTPARLGGDEFAVILVNTEEAVVVAQRILDAIQRPMILGTKEISIAASIGIAAVDDDTYDSDDLSRNADLALYEAKNAGKGVWALYEASMHNDVVHRLNITNEMRQGVERHEFEPWFQPIINLSEDGLAGMECLARWHHPVRGILAPAEFMSVAEETGLIDGIGREIFARAIECTDQWIRRYPAHSDMRIAVNISGRQLNSDSIVDFIAETINDSAVRPEQVVLEITESVLLPGEGIPVERLQKLADLGISLYIDDFGTGWSSLRYLRNLPVRGIKLAQEFVNGLPAEEEVGMVRAVLDLAKTLGLDEVVAEGVERDEQRRALRALGYTLAQGHLLEAPMPAENVEKMLAERPSSDWDPTARPYDDSRSAVASGGAPYAGA